MRGRITSVLLAVIPAALVACGGPKSDTKPDSAAAPAAATAKVDKSADEAAIKDIAKRWQDMLPKKDSAGIAAFFADDGVEFNPGEPVAKGPDAVRKAYGGLFQMKDLNFTFASETITVSDAGDLATDRGTYKISFTPPKGPKVNDHGNYVTVFKKVNGQWKVLYDIATSEVPPPQ